MFARDYEEKETWSDGEAVGSFVRLFVYVLLVVVVVVVVFVFAFAFAFVFGEFPARVRAHVYMCTYVYMHTFMYMHMQECFLSV